MNIHVFHVHHVAGNVLDDIILFGLKAELVAEEGKSHPW